MKALYFQNDKEPLELDVLSINDDQTATLGRGNQALVSNVPLLEAPMKPGTAVLIKSSENPPNEAAPNAGKTLGQEPKDQAEDSDDILSLMNHDDEDEEPQIEDKKRKKA